ncbi:MAG: TadE/TadG family type IV pilus assembly protein [Eubacterium sp.]
MKIKRKNKKENGQAMLEFVLVLPVFLLILFMIMDYGWLFFNYISVENSARNAARIACVEYQDCSYDEASGTPVIDEIFELDDVSPYFDTSGMDPDEIPYTQQEIDILRSVDLTLPDSVQDVKIKISYSYDSDPQTGLGYNVNDRSNGDVTVTVQGTIRVFTPVLGNADNHMQKKIASSSTYKVEKNNSSANDD